MVFSIRSTSSGMFDDSLWMGVTTETFIIVKCSFNVRQRAATLDLNKRFKAQLQRLGSPENKLRANSFVSMHLSYVNARSMQGLVADGAGDEVYPKHRRTEGRACSRTNLS